MKTTVKAHLLRLSNVKAGITSDIDDMDAGKPTLKRRQPEADPTAPDAAGTSSSSKDAPPKLKKRGDEPAPTPTPTPNPEN